jgi:hypothetical protein
LVVPLLAICELTVKLIINIINENNFFIIENFYKMEIAVILALIICGDKS